MDNSKLQKLVDKRAEAMAIVAARTNTNFFICQSIIIIITCAATTRRNIVSG